jgi:hypothetical protein
MNYRILRNEMKRPADKAKKEYLESVCDDLTEFQTGRRYDLPYMETKELGWKEHCGIQNIGAEFSEGNIIADNGTCWKFGRIIQGTS